MNMTEDSLNWDFDYFWLQYAVGYKKYKLSKFADIAVFAKFQTLPLGNKMRYSNFDFLFGKTTDTPFHAEKLESIILKM